MLAVGWKEPNPRKERGIRLLRLSAHAIAYMSAAGLPTGNGTLSRSIVEKRREEKMGPRLLGGDLVLLLLQLLPVRVVVATERPLVVVLELGALRLR